MARYPRNRELLVSGLAGLSGGNAGGGAVAGCAAALHFGGTDHRDRQGLRIFGAVHQYAGIPRRHRLARAIKAANPKIKIAFVGPHVTVLPEKSLRECPALDFVARKEFDYAVVDYAKGKPLEEIPGISFLKDGKVVHNPDAPQIQDLDALPHVTDVYKRDLDVTRYNVPFLLNPYVSLYTTRGCPAQCTFCLWPQTLSGHPWRKRSTDDVARGDGEGKGILARGKGILLRRRHLQHPESAHDRAMRQAEAAGFDMVVHLAGHDRLRNSKGDEGSGMPLAHRGL